MDHKETDFIAEIDKEIDKYFKTHPFLDCQTLKEAWKALDENLLQLLPKEKWPSSTKQLYKEVQKKVFDFELLCEQTCSWTVWEITVTKLNDTIHDWNAVNSTQAYKLIDEDESDEHIRCRLFHINKLIDVSARFFA